MPRAAATSPPSTSWAPGSCVNVPPTGSDADDNGPIALVEALRRGHFDAARRLVEHGASVGETSGYETPLLGAVQTEAAPTERRAMVEWLLERGADPNVVPEGARVSVLGHAAKRGDVALVRRLLEAGVEVRAGGACALHEACDLFGDPDELRETVRMLLDAWYEQALDLNDPDPLPVVSCLIRGNQLGLIDEVVARGAELAPDIEEGSPLRLAIVYKRPVELLRRLLDAGFDPERDRTYLDLAASSKNEPAIRELFARGLRPSVGHHDAVRAIVGDWEDDPVALRDGAGHLVQLAREGTLDKAMSAFGRWMGWTREAAVDLYLQVPEGAVEPNGKIDWTRVPAPAREDLTRPVTAERVKPWLRTATGDAIQGLSRWLHVDDDHPLAVDRFTDLVIAERPELVHRALAPHLRLGPTKRRLIERYASAIAALAKDEGASANFLDGVAAALPAPEVGKVLVAYDERDRSLHLSRLKAYAHGVEHAPAAYSRLATRALGEAKARDEYYLRVEVRGLDAEQIHSILDAVKGKAKLFRKLAAQVAGASSPEAANGLARMLAHAKQGRCAARWLAMMGPVGKDACRQLLERLGTKKTKTAARARELAERVLQLPEHVDLVAGLPCELPKPALTPAPAWTAEDDARRLDPSTYDEPSGEPPHDPLPLERAEAVLRELTPAQDALPPHHWADLLQLMAIQQSHKDLAWAHELATSRGWLGWGAHPRRLLDAVARCSPIPTPGHAAGLLQMLIGSGAPAEVLHHALAVMSHDQVPGSHHPLTQLTAWSIDDPELLRLAERAGTGRATSDRASPIPRETQEQLALLVGFGDAERLRDVLRLDNGDAAHALAVAALLADDEAVASDARAGLAGLGEVAVPWRRALGIEAGDDAAPPLPKRSFDACVAAFRGAVGDLIESTSVLGFTRGLAKDDPRGGAWTDDGATENGLYLDTRPDTGRLDPDRLATCDLPPVAKGLGNTTGTARSAGVPGEWLVMACRGMARGSDEDIDGPAPQRDVILAAWCVEEGIAVAAWKGREPGDLPAVMGFDAWPAARHFEDRDVAFYV